MKSAPLTIALLGALVVFLLAGEIFFLVRGWSDLEALRVANQLQIQANGRLEAEIDGLKVSQPRINALFALLNESVARTRSLELSQSPTTPPPTPNPAPTTP